MFNEIETRRLVLKNIGYEDIGFIQKQFSTDEVNKYLFDTEPITTDEEAKELINFYVKPEPRCQHRWILILKGTNEKIGTCGFHCWDKAKSEVQIGYDLQPNFWHKGLMTEALEAILLFSKEEMEVKKVIACIYVINKDSIKTVEKFGFIKTDKRYFEVFREKKYLHNVYVMNND